MRWRVLNPLSATGFLLPDGCGRGRDLLLDMQGSKDTLAASLACVGSAPERISHVFLTHFHSDHFSISDALALARHGTRIYLGSASLAAAKEYYAREQDAAVLAAYHKLERADVLTLLPAIGSMDLDGVSVCWAAFPHGDGASACENLAFRFDDHLFSGDAPVNALLDPAAPGSAALWDGVRVLCVNVAQLSRAQIGTLTDLPARRVRNYLENHGILEDLLAAVEAPRYARLFSNLEMIVPHHLRRMPLEETAAIIRQRLEETARKMGYRFTVCFPGADGIFNSLAPFR